MYRRSHRLLIHVLSIIVLLAAIVPANTPAPVAVSAQAGTCADTMKTNWTARVCIESQIAGATLTGNAPITITVSTVSGTVPAVKSVKIYLVRVSNGSRTTLASDYVAPYGIQLDTTRWVDGAYRVQAVAVFSPDIESVRPEAAVNLVNGVTIPPVNPGSFVPRSAGGGSVNIVAVGDGAGGLPGADAVGSLAVAQNPSLFFYLGDVYNSGTITEFQNYYHPTLGPLYDRTNPVPGNHESGNNFRGYMDYWGLNSHYYSVTAGSWNVLAIDSTTQYGQTAAGTGQYAWLEQNLQANPSACTMVIMHHPRYGLGSTSGNAHMQDIWSLLSAHGVDVVLAGHEHNYQRWQPLDANGSVVPDGIVQYVVGTGGHELMGFHHADSRVAYRVRTDGVLSMSLNDGGATSSFISTSGAVSDSSSVTCHGSPGQATPTPIVTPTPTPTPSPTATPNPGTPISLEPEADAYVAAANPTTNYGTRSNLRADASPQEMSYLRFNVQGISHPVQRATLRLWVRDSSVNAPAVAMSSDVAWGERTINWDNKPAVGGTIADLGTAELGTWVEYDVTTQVAGNGLLTFALVPQASDALSVNSRENTINRPQLVIEQIVSPTPVATPIGTPVGTPIGTPIGTPVGTPIGTPVGTPVGTPTGTPVGTPTGTPVGTPVGTPTGTPTTTPTATATPSPTATATPSPTATATPSPTATATPSPTATATPSPTATATPSPTATATPSPTATASGGTFVAIHDARVVEAIPAANYGSSSRLQTDGGRDPDVESYLTFEVSGITGPVTTATIRIFVPNGTYSGSVDGPSVYPVSDTTWSESTITWNSRPTRGSALYDLGPVAANTWVTLDVTAAVSGNGRYSFALAGVSADATDFSSSETGTPPELIINGEVAAASNARVSMTDAVADETVPSSTQQPVPTHAPTSTPEPTLAPTPASTPTPTPEPTLAPTPTNVPTLPSGTITGGPVVNCRTSASLDAPIVATLGEGEIVPIRGPQEGEWIPVTCADQPGYVHASFITGDGITAPIPTEPALPEPTAESIEPTAELIETIPTETEAAPPESVPTEVPLEAQSLPITSGWTSDASVPWWLMTDEDPVTTWYGSVWDASIPAEAGFDLGSPQPIGRLTMTPTWPMTGIMEIQLSNDGTNWYRSGAYRMDAFVPDQPNDIPIATTARFVRLLFTTDAGVGDVGSIIELQIWADESGWAQPVEYLPLVVPTPAAEPTAPPDAAPAVEPVPSDIPVIEDPAVVEPVATEPPVDPVDSAATPPPLTSALPPDTPPARFSRKAVFDG